MNGGPACTVEPKRLASHNYGLPITSTRLLILPAVNVFSKILGSLADQNDAKDKLAWSSSLDRVDCAASNTLKFELKRHVLRYVYLPLTSDSSHRTCQYVCLNRVTLIN
jgi:hypothetical protein